MAATKSGWWIKVRLDKTECDSITLNIGDRPENSKFWRVWKQGEENEFDAPPEYRDKARLYIKGQVSPEGKNGWFCMMFKKTGVKHFDFDNVEDHEKDQGDTDGECG